METKELQALFLQNKESALAHRYITNEHIKPLFDNYKDFATIEIIGSSVLNDSIFSITIGKGSKRLLMWSQMHGNESTTTKAIFDFLNTCKAGSSITDAILDSCTICLIPILNPDGAKAYTRINANEVDLNRDAQARTQPESKVLRSVFEKFKPDYCFNLHGQRTIFSAGNTNKSATVSFLSPAQDEDCTVTPVRKAAMEIIAVMNKTLQEIIPNQVGVYDDAFNLNCVGDTFQSENTPTILFEAGHFNNDYARDITRELIYISYLTSLSYISKNESIGSNYEAYFDIPENEKNFLDIIIRNAKLNPSQTKTVDIGIQFEERLINEEINFIPIIQKIEDLSSFYGHKEIDANSGIVLSSEGSELSISHENVFVTLNNEKIALFLK